MDGPNYHLYDIYDIYAIYDEYFGNGQSGSKVSDRLNKNCMSYAYDIKCCM